jgi:lysylphosphatidylglycerol synthetase-like protein (DUF2156 family)
MGLAVNKPLAEAHVSPEHAAGGRSSGKMIIVAVLVIVAVLAIIAGIIYFAEPAKSLPSILGTITHPPGRASAHRSLRGTAALVVAVICLVAAWFVSRPARR